MPFALSYFAGRLLLLLLYVRAWRHVPDARKTINSYLVCLSAAAMLWAVSLALPGGWRYVCWGVAVLIDAIGPLVATFRDDKLPLHVEHLPERFGLLVILVLGEAVGGTARGVHDAKWQPVAVIVGLVGYLVAAAMWWIYFDVAATSSSRRLEEPDDEGVPDGADEGIEADKRHDMFVYGHLPMALGIVLAGIGLEEIVLHPQDPVGPAAWVLVGGIAAYLIGIALIIGGTARTWVSVWPWPLLALPAIVVVGALPFPRSWMVVVAAAVICAAAATVGTINSRRPENVETPAD